MLPPDFACMAADCMAVVVVVMHANWALCLVAVAINAAIDIEPPACVFYVKDMGRRCDKCYSL